ncbi:putative ATP-dependent RNA helicase [Talaromyces proteolyticus]|uniref:RNA helicase n=1 Tax=Talaromyces proteolyticus TaxID=1131652 RepID=A0AAD4Q339_9EURO|nr:putative ATP-dependent RNA helicase [Talaromyces proteolyticus]KAH8704694.1 putative ATP-dependent RNA helicase [Talaromyces proteolyticus]
MSKRSNTSEHKQARKRAKRDENSAKYSDDSDGQKNEKKKSKKAYRQSESLKAVSQADIDSFLESNKIEVSDPIEGEQILRPIISFEHLPDEGDAIYKPLRNFRAPTSVQAATWPFLFSGRDVIGIAETGSGKTLGFGLPCLRKMVSLKNKKTKPSCPKAVIITPTRELAMQIHEHLEKYASPLGIKTTCIFGGVKKDDQWEALKSATVVVATPGRLKDLQGEGSVNLGKVKYLVLDEADRMLDKGFEQDIKEIVGTMPVSKRQTAMFTATWPVAVQNLAKNFTQNPITITVGGKPSADPRANTRIKQVVEVLSPRDKETRLLQILGQLQRKSSEDRVLVFCLYKKEATRIERFIQSKGYQVAGIHGDLSQSDRFKSLAAFKSGAVTVLVATDVAARGLDIPEVKTVVNVTFPLTIEDYVHRIGRTGRAGADGHAITLFTENDKTHSGALINVLKAAGQDVPESLLKFGTTVKKKQHGAYGAFFKDVDTAKSATKITFDD